MFTWNLEASWSEHLTRKECEAQLRINEGDKIAEVRVHCDVADEYGDREELFTICGNSVDNICDKAFKLFMNTYHNLLLLIEHGDIIIQLSEEGFEAEAAREEREMMEFEQLLAEFDLCL